jgi:D-sedoheptulose 7-phosphate isomerase
MSLSTTSLAFLRELHKALEGVEVNRNDWAPKGRTLIIGNGGSAAIAAHIANDMNKAGHPALVPDYATLTCFANDIGWDRAMAHWVHVHEGTLIAISSSGQSQNIINACKTAYPNGFVVTLTGFDADNPVRKLGHTNYWVPSHNYGVVECAHLAILHSIVNPG